MITVPRSIEKPLLRALRDYSPQPTLDHLSRCAEVQQVLEAIVSVSLVARKHGIAENERRRSAGLQPLNWRDYLTGGVAIGLAIDHCRSNAEAVRFYWCVAAAHNTKPHTRVPKCCTEMRNNRTALRGRWYRVGLHSITGDPQPDGRSKVGGNHLDPCEACRDEMSDEESRSLYTQDTKIVTFLPDNPDPKVTSLPDLMEKHGERWLFN